MKPPTCPGRGRGHLAEAWSRGSRPTYTRLCCADACAFRPLGRDVHGCGVDVRRPALQCRTLRRPRRRRTGSEADARAPDAIRDAVRQVLTEPSYRANAHAFQQHMMGLPGPEEDGRVARVAATPGTHLTTLHRPSGVRLRLIHASKKRGFDAGEFATFVRAGWRSPRGTQSRRSRPARSTASRLDRGRPPRRRRR